MRVPSHFLISKFQSIGDPMEMLIQQQVWMEDRVKALWSTVSSFEEQSASCISSILLDVANENFPEALQSASQFVLCVESLSFAIFHIAHFRPETGSLEQCDYERKALVTQTGNLLELLEIDFNGDHMKAVGRKGTKEMVKHCFYHFQTNNTLDWSRHNHGPNPEELHSHVCHSAEFEIGKIHFAVIVFPLTNIIE